MKSSLGCNGKKCIAIRLRRWNSPSPPNAWLNKPAEVSELRWQFWKRLSLVGFAGAGAAWNDVKRFENKIEVKTGGVGFRYELAREYGLHMGVDVAFGPNAPIVYVQFGSAWTRP